MGKIIVGCDGSPSAADAVKWAAREGRLRGWSVTALLAWSYLSQPRSAPDEPFNPDFRGADAKAVLDRILERDLGDLAGDLQREAVCDLPARALLEASTDADLLVVGARGLGGFRSALLGSVSQECVHHSKVPVVVVRPVMDGGGSRIVVAIDGSAGSQRALDWALDEARARECHLTVVHAWQPPMYTAWTVPSVWPDMSRLQTEADDVVDAALRRADTRGLPESAIERSVVFGTVAETVLETAHHASLLVVGSRGRGGFAGLLLGSVSQHLVHHAPCPIVVVPPSWHEPRTSRTTAGRADEERSDRESDTQTAER